MTKSDEILTKMIPLSTPVNFPTTFMEVCRIAWQSFTVGRDFETNMEKEQETDYEKRVKEFYETEQERERISKLLIEERMKVLELEEKVKRLELRIAVIELPAQNYNKTLVRAEQAESRLEKLRRAVDSVREERDWDAKECALEELYKAREEL